MYVYITYIFIYLFVSKIARDMLDILNLLHFIKLLIAGPHGGRQHRGDPATNSLLARILDK